MIFYPQPELTSQHNALQAPQRADFILAEGSCDWFASDIIIYQCEFNPAHFVDALYEYYRIEIPDNICQSVIKRRAEFLAGRYCAGKALTQLGVSETSVAIGAHSAPLWPNAITGSISHCNCCALAAVSLNSGYRGIGIDIENKISDTTIDRLNKYVLCAAETKWLPIERDARASLFTLIFSLKESFFKAAFAMVGRYFDFDAVTVLEIDHSTGKIHYKVNGSLADSLPANTLLIGSFHFLPNNRVVTCVTLT